MAAMKNGEAILDGCIFHVPRDCGRPWFFDDQHQQVCRLMRALSRLPAIAHAFYILLPPTFLHILYQKGEEKGEEGSEREKGGPRDGRVRTHRSPPLKLLLYSLNVFT